RLPPRSGRRRRPSPPGDRRQLAPLPPRPPLPPARPPPALPHARPRPGGGGSVLGPAAHGPLGGSCPWTGAAALPGPRGRAPPAPPPPLPPPDSPAPARPPIPRALSAFGREVTGYLPLDVVPAPRQQAGLLYTGTERAPDLPAARPDGAVIPLAAQPGWEDAC